MAGEFMQYMDAFNAGVKAPVDAMNYAPQQQARTDILKQEALQSAQQVQMNDVTLKSNMFKLLSAEKAQKQEEQLAALQAAEAQKLQTGQDKVEDLGGIAQNDNALASFYENLAMKEMTVPGGAASAESHSKLAAELRDKATGSRKKAMDAVKDQVSIASNIASAVKDQASLEQADAQLKAAGIRPPDFPTKWDTRAEKYINTMKNSASSAIDKMKADDDHTKTLAEVKAREETARHNRAQEGLEAQRVKLAREKQADDKEQTAFEKKTFGMVEPNKAKAWMDYYNKDIQSTAKQLKLPEQLAVLRDVNKTFVDENGNLKDKMARAGVDTSSLLWAYVKVNKPDRIGSTKMSEEMAKDLAGLPLRVGNKVVSLGIGKTLDDNTVKAIIRNINAKVKETNSEVARREDEQIEKAVQIGIPRETAERQFHGTAIREEHEAAQKDSYSAATPGVQTIVQQQMKASGISDPEIVFQLLKQKGKL